jgi:hypothetical protein
MTGWVRRIDLGTQARAPVLYILSTYIHLPVTSLRIPIERGMMRIGPIIGSLCIKKRGFYTFQEASDNKIENIYQQYLHMSKYLLIFVATTEKENGIYNDITELYEEQKRLFGIKHKKINRSGDLHL